MNNINETLRSMRKDMIADLERRPNQMIAYAVSYLDVLIEMSAMLLYSKDRELRKATNTQILCVLNNMTHWRNRNAKQYRDSLRAYSEYLKEPHESVSLAQTANDYRWQSINQND